MQAYRYTGFPPTLTPCPDYGPAKRAWADENEPADLLRFLHVPRYTRRERRRLARAKGRRRAVPVPRYPLPDLRTMARETIALWAHCYRAPDGREALLYLPSGQKPGPRDVEALMRAEGYAPP